MIGALTHSGRGTTTGPQARAMLFWASLITLCLCFIPNPYYDVILWPIRLFVTIIHESGHAICTVISGGTVKYLQIHPNGEGVTWGASPEWAQWLVISGGYLGTTLFGALLLQVARLSGHKVTLTMIGGCCGPTILLITCSLWLRDLRFRFSSLLRRRSFLQRLPVSLLRL